MTSTRGLTVVTGGAGLIGSAVVWELNRRGVERILVTDHLRDDEKWRNLRPLKFLDYLDGDEFVQRVRLQPDAFGEVAQVYHLGACSATTERDSGYLMRNNFGVSRDLASWALGRGARFVYASSAATYGDGGHGMNDGEADIDGLQPLNKYGWSKQLFDQHARRSGFDQRVVGCKYFNVFGPNEDHKAGMRSVVHKAFEQIRDRGRVALFKSENPHYRDGEQMRDFLYVKDAAAMTVHLGETVGAGGLYNLGSGEANTWIALVTPIFEALGLEVRIDFIDLPEALRGKYQYYTCAGIDRLRSSGYAAEPTPLAEAVRDYVGNYLVPGLHLGEAEGESVAAG